MAVAAPTTYAPNQSNRLVDDEVVKEASRQEIIRRYFKTGCEYKKGYVDKETFEHAKLIIKEYHSPRILMFYSMIIGFINLFYTHSSLFTFPSTESTIFLIGMLREAISLTFKAICRRPPQQGTSMMRTVSVSIRASSIMLRSLST